MNRDLMLVLEKADEGIIVTVFPSISKFDEIVVA